MRTHIQCAELSTRALQLIYWQRWKQRALKIASVLAMLLKGINMFNRVCSQRRSDVSYGGNQYSRVKTTLQNNHYNRRKAGKHMTDKTFSVTPTFLNLLVFLSLSLNYSLILSFSFLPLSAGSLESCDTQCNREFNLL